MCYVCASLNCSLEDNAIEQDPEMALRITQPFYVEPKVSERAGMEGGGRN